MKMKKVLVSLLVGVGLMVGLSSQAQAVPEFINQPLVGGIDFANVLNPFSLAVGDVVTGNATYDRTLLSGPIPGVTPSPSDGDGDGVFFTLVDGNDLNNFSFNFGSFSLLANQALGFGTAAGPAMKFEDDFDFNYRLAHFDARFDLGVIGFDGFELTLDGNSGPADPFDPFGFRNLAGFSILATVATPDFLANETVVTGFFGLPDRAFQPQNQPVIPEPSTIILLGMGLGGLAVLRHRQKKA